MGCAQERRLAERDMRSDRLFNIPPIEHSPAAIFILCWITAVPVLVY